MADTLLDDVCAMILREWNSSPRGRKEPGDQIEYTVRPGTDYMRIVRIKKNRQEVAFFLVKPGITLPELTNIFHGHD